MVIVNSAYEKTSCDERTVVKILAPFAGLFIVFAEAWLLLNQKSYLIAALLLFACFLLVGIHTWRWSVYGLLAYLPFAGIPILALYPSKLPLLAKDFFFVIPAYMGFFVTGILKGENRSFPNRLLLGLMISFGVLVVAQLFNPMLENKLVGLIGLKVWLLYMPLTVLTYHLIDSVETLNRLARFMVLLALIPAIVVIIEFVLIYCGFGGLVHSFYGSRAASATQQFSQFYIGGAILSRIPGLFQSSTQNYCFLLSMVAMASGNVFLEKYKSPKKLRMSLLYLAIITVACLLCGVRRSLVFVPLFFLLLAILQREVSNIARLIFVMGIGVAVVTYAFSYSALYSHLAQRSAIAYDFEVKEGLVQAIQNNPQGLGTGMDTNPARHAFSNPAKFIWHSESYYAKAVYELGIPGLLILLFLFGYILVKAYSGYRRMEDDALKSFASVLLAFFVLIMIDSSKAHPLDIAPINVYFWVFVGISAKLPLLKEEMAESGEERDE